MTSIVAQIKCNTLAQAEYLCSQINTHEHCNTICATVPFVKNEYYILTNENNNLCKNVLTSLLNHPMIGQHYEIVKRL